MSSGGGFLHKLQFGAGRMSTADDTDDQDDVGDKKASFKAEEDLSWLQSFDALEVWEENGATKNCVERVSKDGDKPIILDSLSTDVSYPTTSIPQ